MDLPTGPPTAASAPPLDPSLRAAARSPRRRRPTGAAPPAQQDLAGEAASAIGLTTRQELARALSRRSDGRLQLDP